MTTTLPLNQHYAVSNNSIAIAKDDSSSYGMIYIYPIIKSLDDQQSSDEYIKQDVYRFDPHHLENVKKLRYSNQPMDITYSSRYISLSKSGRYLAISWLSNPRLGYNNAMKYCYVYDLKYGPYCCFDGFIEDHKVTNAIPCGIFEFQGGCTFTDDGKFVLINDTNVSVYSIHSNRENEGLFELDFSLNMSSTNQQVSIKDDTFPTYHFFPFALTKDDSMDVDEITNVDSKAFSSTTVKDNNDINFDDIFFDESDSEYPSDLEVDKDINMVNNNVEDQIIRSFNDSTQYQEKNTDSYESFQKNDRFIRTNIENIKNDDVVCSTTKGMEKIKSYCAWSLKDRKLIFTKQLEERKENSSQESIEHIAAFTKQKNLVAFSQQYRLFKDVTSKDLGKESNPLCKIYDCNSGIFVAQLVLPHERTTTGVSQILFLQNDTYILTVSYNYWNCFFDIWDVSSSTHLDTYSINRNESKTCIEHSRFVKSDALQLKFGCGVFIKVDLPHPNDTNPTLGASCIPSGSFNLSIKKLDFFNDNSNYKCNCGHAKAFWVPHQKDQVDNKYQCTLKPYSGQSNLLIMDTIPGTSESLKLSSSNNLNSRDKSIEFVFFLDENRTHIMACTWNPSKSKDTLVMMVWEITINHRDELKCTSHFQNHDIKIRLQQLKYSFVLERNSFLRKDNKSTLGYPGMFLDMDALSEYCIESLAPTLLYSNEPNRVPVLLMKMNYNVKDDLVLGYFKERIIVARSDKKKRLAYTVAIPLHQYSSIEHYLSVLANESMLSISQDYQATKSKYVYNIFNSYFTKSNDTEEDDENIDPINDLILMNTGYFSTLGGYAAICQLAKSDRYYETLSKILTETTKVNYCSLSTNMNDQLVHPLQQALEHGAPKNAQLIIKHIEYSISTYGYLLSKNSDFLLA